MSDFTIDPIDFIIGGVLSEDLKDAEIEFDGYEKNIDKMVEKQDVDKLDKISMKDANKKVKRGKSRMKPFERWVDGLCNGEYTIDDDIPLRH